MLPSTQQDASSISPVSKFTQALEAYVKHPERLPAYFAGHHPHWDDRDDHCYSFLFRVAIEQKLIAPSTAKRLMGRIQPGNPDSLRAAIFPQGFTQLPLRIHGERVSVPSGAIPAGHLISLDGGAHVMVSTGRLVQGGRHEVYSFKGGGPETPVWGDSVGFDPQPRLHVVTLEHELEALLRDDQPIEDVVVAVGPSALTGP
jgi:hypothetical protein